MSQLLHSAKHTNVGSAGFVVLNFSWYCSSRTTSIVLPQKSKCICLPVTLLSVLSPQRTVKLAQKTPRKNKTNNNNKKQTYIFRRIINCNIRLCQIIYTVHYVLNTQIRSQILSKFYTNAIFINTSNYFVLIKTWNKR